jgi:hypothetical protein
MIRGTDDLRDNAHSLHSRRWPTQRFRAFLRPRRRASNHRKLDSYPGSDAEVDNPASLGYRSVAGKSQLLAVPALCLASCWAAQGYRGIGTAKPLYGSNGLCGPI